MFRPDDSALAELEAAARTAEGSSNAALSIVTYGLAVALVHRDAAADRDRGLELMMQVREMWLREPIPFLVPVAELWIARDKARRGEYDAPIRVMRKTVDELHRAGRPFFELLGIGFLVETLLELGADDDVAEAQEAIETLANLHAQEDWAMRDMTLLRLRALLAHTRGDQQAYPDLVQRYREMAETLGFSGHTAWAEAMVEPAVDR